MRKFAHNLRYRSYTNSIVNLDLINHQPDLQCLTKARDEKINQPELNLPIMRTRAHQVTRKRYWFTTLGAIVHIPDDFIRPEHD